LIKIPKAHQPNAYKKALLETLEHFKDQAWMKGVRILIDVDPMQ
jgi:predicted peroxiredoxin